MVLITDKISRASLSNGVRSEPTTLASPKGIGDSSITCDDLSTWDTTTPQHFQIYRKDTQGAIIDSSRSDWKGIVVANTLTQLTLTGGNDDNYTTGSYVICLPTTQFANDLYIGLTQTLNQSDGSLKDNIVTTAKINNNAVTTAKIVNQAVTADKLSLATSSNTASVSTSEGTIATSYADLATVGPSVTVTIGANGVALVLFSASAVNNDANNFSLFTFVASGANTISAGTYRAGGKGLSDKEAGSHVLLTGLTPGSTTFKMQYVATGGTATFNNRRLTVIPL